MSLKLWTRPLARTAVAGVFAVSALSLTACSEDTAGPETGTDVEDVQEEDVVEEDVEEDVAADGPYDGLYDTAFYDDINSYVGEEVTLSADVNEVISSSSFTIAGTDDTDVEALLVVSATEVTDLEPDLTVAVTGTVEQAFDLTTVEEDLGVDLDDDLYDAWDQEPYLVASSVDTSVASDQ